MKKYILGALLVGGLAGQSAFAEIRTFDFTASVASVATAANPFASSITGIEDGTRITTGDLIKGQLSFDDLGIDFTAASAYSGLNQGIKFSYSFAIGNPIDVTPPLWSHSPSQNGGLDLFNMVGMNAAQSVVSSLFLYSPGNAFSWELGNGTSGQLAVTWSGGSINANLSNLVEVTPVPEPATYGMMLLGAAVVAGAAKRRAARRAA